MVVRDGSGLRVEVEQTSSLSSHQASEGDLVAISIWSNYGANDISKGEGLSNCEVVSRLGVDGSIPVPDDSHSEVLLSLVAGVGCVIGLEAELVLGCMG